MRKYGYIGGEQPAKGKRRPPPRDPPQEHCDGCGRMFVGSALRIVPGGSGWVALCEGCRR